MNLQTIKLALKILCIWTDDQRNRRIGVRHVLKCKARGIVEHDRILNQRAPLWRRHP